LLISRCFHTLLCNNNFKI